MYVCVRTFVATSPQQCRYNLSFKKRMNILQTSAPPRPHHSFPSCINGVNREPVYNFFFILSKWCTVVFARFVKSLNSKSLTNKTQFDNKNALASYALHQLPANICTRLMERRSTAIVYFSIIFRFGASVCKKVYAGFAFCYGGNKI